MKIFFFPLFHQWEFLCSVYLDFCRNGTIHLLHNKNGNDIQLSGEDVEDDRLAANGDEGVKYVHDANDNHDPDARNEDKAVQSDDDKIILALDDIYPDIAILFQVLDENIQIRTDEDCEDVKLIDIHPRCKKLAEKFRNILNTFRNLPHNKNIILIGDSNFRCVKEDLVPVMENSVLHAVSGLCIVGAAYALKDYKLRHLQVEKIVWSLGVNDYFHQTELSVENWHRYVPLLVNESKRIFRGAVVHFILPFEGLPRIPLEHIQEIHSILKLNFPCVKKHCIRSMQGKVKNDGIHIDDNGAHTLRDFLLARFSQNGPGRMIVHHPPTNPVSMDYHVNANASHEDKSTKKPPQYFNTNGTFGRSANRNYLLLLKIILLTPSIRHLSPLCSCTQKS